MLGPTPASLPMPIGSPVGQANLQAPRLETVERSFDAKLHGHRYIRLRGRLAVSCQCLLAPHRTSRRSLSPSRTKPCRKSTAFVSGLTPPSGGLPHLTRRADQAAAKAGPFRLRRYPMKPSTPRPRSIIPHVAGKGVAALMVKLPSATQFEQTPAKPKLANKYPAPLTAENQASDVPTLKLCPVGAKRLAYKLVLWVPWHK